MNMEDTMGEDPMMDEMMHGDMSGHGHMEPGETVDTSDMAGDHGHGNTDHGMDHSNMDHGNMGHGNMDHGNMDHGNVDHGNMNHGSMDQSSSIDDMGTNAATGGHLHHGANAWQAGESNGFCRGQAGMVMIMEGFQWALKGESTCINLYFPGWTLDSAGKVVAAMFGVIGLAIATEAISKYRHTLSVKAKSASVSERKKLSMIQIALHGGHAFIGYILMLATMTYSLELLLCVILGLVIGYTMFGGDTYNHVSTNPCCAFLEDEAMERETAQEGGSSDPQTGDCCTPKDTRTIAQSEVSNNSTDLDGVEDGPVFSA